MQTYIIDSRLATAMADTVYENARFLYSNTRLLYSNTSDVHHQEMNRACHESDASQTRLTRAPGRPGVGINPHRRINIATPGRRGAGAQGRRDAGAQRCIGVRVQLF